MGSGPAGNRQMLRERVLAALEHFWSPLGVDDELRPYLEGVWGQPVPADALARLLAVERAAFDRDGPQGVWVGVGICPDGRGDPERWVRADWPLWVRVVDPAGERVRRYWLLRQLYRAPVKPGGPGTEPLTDLWERLAGDLPAREVACLRRHAPEDLGRRVDWEQDRFSIWGEVADWQFELLAREDRHRRERIAEQLALLSPTAQRFGRDPTSQSSGVLSCRIRRRVMSRPMAGCLPVQVLRLGNVDLVVWVLEGGDRGARVASPPDRAPQGRASWAG